MGQLSHCEESVVFQAECLPQGHCKSVLEALIMANNVHEEHEDTLNVLCQKRINGGPMVATTEALGQLWKQFRKTAAG